MSDVSARLGLPYLLPAQAQKHVTHNEALRLLDAVTQLAVLAADQSEPPSAPQTGDCYIVPGGATGAWAGQEGRIAVFDVDGWNFFDPRPGWRADVVPTGEALRFDGTTWVSAERTLENLPGIGINATSDQTNRLAIASHASLFSHDGAGHQMKLNKASQADTASLLFQTGWSGRAEIGTTGSDDLAVKVSIDGATFREALSIDGATGAVRMPSGQNYFEDVFILDDTFYAFDIPWSNPARILLWLAVNIQGYHYLISVSGQLTGAPSFAKMFEKPAGTLNFLSGALSGTTGPDGAVNLSIDDSSGTPRMYVENRLGTNRLFTLATLGK